MEITKYNQLKINDMPIEVFTATASFSSINTYDNLYEINGTWSRTIIVGKRAHINIGKSFIDEKHNSIFLYHGNNPNKVFTTIEEAKAWSKTNLGYID